MTKKIFGILLPEWVDEEALRKLVYSFLGLVVAILVSILFVWPRFADLYKEEKDLKKLENSLEVLSGSVDRVQEFENNLGEDELSILSLAVPKTFDPGIILSSLRQISASTGVIIESYELSKGVGEIDVDKKIQIKDGMVNLNKHRVMLKLVGSSDRLIRFIDLLGKSLPVSIISELSLSEISKLFTIQGLSQLEMEITYFESDLAEVSLDKVVGFTDKNEQLLGEILLYSKPNITENNLGGQTGRQGSLFGL